MHNVTVFSGPYKYSYLLSYMPFIYFGNRHRWYSGRSWTKDSEVPTGPLLSSKLEQVIYSHGAQAISAFHPSRVGK